MNENVPPAPVWPPASQAEIAAVMDNVTVFSSDYEVRILSGVCLQARRGEVLGVIGPVHSGKSTLLRVLAGRLRPVSGVVKVFGRSPCRRATQARIGYLPESSGATSDSVFAGWLGGVKKWFGGSQRRPAEGLPRQTERLASLQNAVLGNRDLLVLDEPLAGLDPAGRRQTADLIRTLARHGKTVVISGSAIMEAIGLCDRIAVIYEGKLRGIGTLDALLGGADAVHVFALVLPRDISERLLATLREKVLDAARSAAQGDATQPAANPAPAAAADAVDHGRLAQLTKPPAP
ncbi:MAG: ATP-binding cassette domain-containing protein [Verrucomicrobiota bacterium]|jgi:ABC-type multidrug transport system ATPase subunit